MSNPAGYSRAQIALHWVVAALIVPQFIFHDAISEAWRAFSRGIEFEASPLVAAHVIGGILIGLFVVWRLVIRARRGAPPPPEAEHPLLQMLAKLAHGALYLVLILLVVSGGMTWFGGVAEAGEVHEVLKGLLLALVGLHVVAVIYHQFVLRTNLIQRMKRAA